MALKPDDVAYLLALEELEGNVGLSEVGQPSSGEALSITFPTTPLQSKVFMARNPDYSLDYQLWDWIDLSSGDNGVRWDTGITIEAGRLLRDDVPRAASASFVCGNSNGELSRENPMSSNYGLIGSYNPVWIQNNCGDGWFDRYFGWTEDLPQGITHFDSTISITCLDALNHLLQTQTLKSAVYRTVSGLNASFTPAEWWTLEDGSQATGFASVVGGTTGTVNQSPANSLLVAKPGQGQAMLGGPQVALIPQLSLATLPIRSYTDTGQWTAMCAFYLTEADTNARMILSGPLYSVYLQIGGTNGLEAGVTELAPLNFLFGDTALTNPADVLNRWIIVAVTNIDGSNQINFEVFDTDGNIIISDYTSFAGATQYEKPTAFKAYAFNGSSDALSAGHAVFFTDLGFNPATDGLSYMNAVGGWYGEMMHNRGARIAAEEGFTWFCQADESEELGVQPYTKAVDLLRQGAKADNGILYGYKFGLGYRALNELLNQDVALALDADQGHLPKELRSIDNTSTFYNQWTVRRNDGSVATEQVQGGVPSGDPVFGGDDSFNLATDGQTVDLASFLANRDAARPAQWPNIRVSLAKNPGLIPQWREMQHGSRFTVEGLTSYAGTMDLDLVRHGYVEFFNSKIWDATLTGGDGTYLQVGTADDAAFQIDSDSSTIRADVTSTATYFEVFTEDLGDLWTTTREASEDFPLDIKVAGEVITVSDIDSATVDTFTRTTSNGWGTNDTDQVWTATGGSAGDFATTGTKGTITLPTGDTAARNVILEGVNYSDLTILATVSCSATALTQNLSARLWFRRRDGSTGYRLRLNFDTGGNVDLDMFAVVNDISNGIGAASNYVTYTPGSNIYVRIDAYGNSIKVKVWTSGDEPAGYALQITDTTFQFGTVGCNAQMTAGNTNVNPVISFDDYFVTNPQGFTVTRSVNGIVKAHKANMGDKISGVHVRYPLRLTP